MECLILIIFTVLINFTIINRSEVNGAKKYRKIYGSKDIRYPHFHVFCNGTTCDSNEASKIKRIQPGGRGSRFLGNIFGGGRGGDEGSDPLLESSRHYTLGTPFYVGGTSMVPPMAAYEITDFVFRMCDDNNYYPLTFHYFGLELPARMPGHVKANFNFTTTHDITAPLEVHVEGYKGVLGALLKVPCVLGLGSCIYHDGCQIFRYWETGGCPQIFEDNNMPCDCPYPIGNYVVKSLDYTVFLQNLPEVPGPSFFTDGSYFARMRLKKDSETLTCFKVNMVIRSA